MVFVLKEITLGIVTCLLPQINYHQLEQLPLVVLQEDLLENLKLLVPLNELNQVSFLQ